MAAHMGVPPHPAAAAASDPGAAAAAAAAAAAGAQQPAPFADLSSVCFRDQIFLNHVGGFLTAHVVFDYFANSPFYDRNCSNEQLRMQGIHPLDTSHLRNMVGWEYALHVVEEPLLFVLRRQKRDGPDKVTVAGLYYVLDANVYQAPSLHAVIGSRVARAVYHLRSAFNEMRSEVKEYQKHVEKAAAATSSSAASERTAVAGAAAAAAAAAAGPDPAEVARLDRSILSALQRLPPAPPPPFLPPPSQQSGAAEAAPAQQATAEGPAGVEAAAAGNSEAVRARGEGSAAGGAASSREGASTGAGRGGEAPASRSTAVTAVGRGGPAGVAATAAGSVTAAAQRGATVQNIGRQERGASASPNSGQKQASQPGRAMPHQALQEQQGAAERRSRLAGGSSAPDAGNAMKRQRR